MINVSQERGAGLIEVVVGLAIVLGGVFALLRTYNYFLILGLSHKYDIQAAFLLEEGAEAVRLLRDESWINKISGLDSGVQYGLAFENSKWTSTTTDNYIGGVFNRKFTLEDVYRDSSDNISSSGSLDPNSKKVVVSVSYRNGLSTSTKSISAYIMNLFNN